MTLEIDLTAALVLAFVLAAGLWFAARKRRHEQPSQSEFLARLVSDFQKEITTLQAAVKDQSLDLSRQLHLHASESARMLQEAQSGYQSVMGGVQHRLGELQEATTSMMAISRDISSLQDILRSPKLRGGLGEFLLAELLNQVLPTEHFELQYAFKSGVRVDAVIRLGEALLSVDAKFPLENFRRMSSSSEAAEKAAAKKMFSSDVKKHIDAICTKYIVPEESTYDFAFMYIPAENVYYEIILKEDPEFQSLSQYALSRQVIPVSPNTFYAYLQVILRGLKGLRIEKSARLILESLGQLENDFRRCCEEFERVGGHLGHAGSAYERTRKRMEKIQMDLAGMEARKQSPEAQADEQKV